MKVLAAYRESNRRAKAGPTGEAVLTILGEYWLNHDDGVRAEAELFAALRSGEIVAKAATEPDGPLSNIDPIEWFRLQCPILDSVASLREPALSKFYDLRLSGADVLTRWPDAGAIKGDAPWSQ